MGYFPCPLGSTRAAEDGKSGVGSYDPVRTPSRTIKGLRRNRGMCGSSFCVQGAQKFKVAHYRVVNAHLLPILQNGAGAVALCFRVSFAGLLLPLGFSQHRLFPLHGDAEELFRCFRDLIDQLPGGISAWLGGHDPSAGLLLLLLRLANLACAARDFFRRALVSRVI